MGKRAVAFRTAWEMTKKELVGSTARLFTAVALTGFASFASYWLHTALKREWAGDELIPIFVGPLGFVVIFGLALLFNFLFRAPYELWGNAEELAAIMERKLQPSFSVPYMVGGKAKRLDYGHANRSPYTGSTQFVIRRSHNLFCIPVVNETSSSLKGCEAYLARFREQFAEDGYWESMRLQWVPVGDEQTTVDIPSHGKRSVVVFQLSGKRVHLVSDSAPVAMVSAIKEKGMYDGLVVLTAQNTAATYIAFQLCCNGPDEEPTLSILRKGIGQSDEETGWAFEQPF